MYLGSTSTGVLERTEAGRPFASDKLLHLAPTSSLRASARTMVPYLHQIFTCQKGALGSKVVLQKSSDDVHYVLEMMQLKM